MGTSDLSIKELAVIIGVSTDTIRRAVRKGELPATRVESMPSPAVKNGPSPGQLSSQLSQTPPPNLSLEEWLQRLK